MEEDLTPEAALLRNLDLTVYCDPCRVGRPVDLMALAVAKPGRLLRKMTFRCSKCGSTRATIILAVKPGHRDHKPSGGKR